MIIVVLAVIYFGLDSKISLYMVIAAIIIVALVSRGSIEGESSDVETFGGRRNWREEEMAGREKK